VRHRVPTDIGTGRHCANGRELQRTLDDTLSKRCRPIMNKANEGNDTRQLAFDLGFVSIVPSLSTRLDPWTSRATWYRHRNQTERLFRRLKGLRRTFSSFDKSDVTLLGLAYFALIVEALR
jgi:transposase